ncbi:MAG: AraC family transcriptional regulator [Lachnospiraceae bacterium]|jgi:AraC-like DNA-binding protein
MDKDLYNSGKGVVFKEKIPGLRVSEAVRHEEFEMRAKHVHETIELFFLLEGHRFFFLEQETYLLDEGCAMLVNHDLIHRTSPAEGYAPDHHNFILQIDRQVYDGVLKSLFQMDFDTFGSLNNGIARFSEADWQLILSLIDAFKRADRDEDATEKNPYLVMLAATLLATFARVRRQGNEMDYNRITKSRVVNSGIYRKVHEISMYLQNNYAKNLSLDELAGRFYMSKSYLTRIFREVTGFSVVEYTNFIRVRRAQEMLKTTKENITDIAAATGFGNITYFEKVFRVATGQKPSQYRKKLQEEQQ